MTTKNEATPEQRANDIAFVNHISRTGEANERAAQALYALRLGWLAMKVDRTPLRTTRPKLYRNRGWLELPQAVRMAAAKERQLYAECRELANKAWRKGDRQGYARIKLLRDEARAVMQYRVDYEMHRLAYWDTRWDI